MSSANNSDCDTTRPCSYCKREVAVANFVLHEAHCMRHIALCPQCKEPVPKAQLNEHVTQEHSKVPCALCEKEFERHELEDHKANSCHQRPVTCQYCEIELPMSKMQEHEDACGSRTEKCLTCQSYIMIKHADEHKMSNCRPPEEEEDWKPEEAERPHKFGYVDERPHKFGYVDEQPHKFDYVDEYDGYPVNEFDDHDDMLPCEFCGMPFPFDYLIQHESGCDQNVMLGNASAHAHQPRQVYPPEDMHADATRNTVSELKDLNINSSNKERKNVVENSHKPEEQEHSHRLPSKQKPAADPSEKSTVEKMNIDKSNKSLDSEIVHNGTSTAKENYASGCDVIPCEFCDSPIELTLLMEHQKMCRWIHSNKAFRQEPHFAVNGENEDDFDESPTRYQHRFPRGRGNASPSRGYTNGNTKWTSERNNSHAASTSKYPYTEKRSYREVENDPENNASETSSYQSRSQGRSSYRSYHQGDRRQTYYAEDETHRYKGRMEHDRGSRWQREDQNKVRPLMDFDSDDVRQEGQREEKRPARQQHGDNPWSKGQQEQRDRASERRQVRNENPRTLESPRTLRPESANLRLEGRIGTVEEQKKQNGTVEEQRKGPGHQPQRNQEHVGLGQHRTRGTEDEVVAGVEPEEENWRRKRPTDGEVRARSSRGRGGRPDQNRSNAHSRGGNAHSHGGNARSHEGNGRSHEGNARSHEGNARSHEGNARSHGDEEENETAEEPTLNARTAERTRGGQTQQNLRRDEGHDARPRRGDDQGQAWSGRRGQVRGRYNWRRERWNRAKGQAEEECYNAPWPRRSNRDENE